MFPASATSFDASTASLLAALEDELSKTFVVRYISVASYACLAYDHLLTTRDEAQLVWNAPNSIAKWGFLVYRYGTLVTLALVIYSTCGSAIGLNIAFCRRLIPVLTVLSVVFGCISDAIAVLHLSSLWRRNNIVLLRFLALFACTTLIAIVFSGIATAQITSSIGYDPSWNVCVSELRPLMLGAPWVCGVCFHSTRFSLTNLKTPLPWHHFCS
ncbi:hypothetical protein K439DRAFT_1632009 [Ramaria rubella]|nr:hypothetical protein K439DRAFT_1632009 [Ramaria rubella]